MKGKLVSESAIHDQTVVVFPDDLNPLGTVFGGMIMAQSDRIAGVVAKRHSNRVCVTLGIDTVRFLAPAKHGDILVFKACINRVWNTSMEIGIKVFKEDFITGENAHILSAYFTFVALDEQFQPVKIPHVIPKTKEEKRRYREADQRRKTRLKQKY